MGMKPRPRPIPRPRLVQDSDWNWTNSWSVEITIGGVRFTSMDDWLREEAERKKAKIKAALART